MKMGTVPPRWRTHARTLLSGNSGNLKQSRDIATRAELVKPPMPSSISSQPKDLRVHCKGGEEIREGCKPTATAAAAAISAGERTPGRALAKRREICTKVGRARASRAMHCRASATYSCITPGHGLYPVPHGGSMATPPRDDLERYTLVICKMPEQLHCTELNIHRN